MNSFASYRYTSIVNATSNLNKLLKSSFSGPPESIPAEIPRVDGLWSSANKIRWHSKRSGSTFAPL